MTTGERIRQARLSRGLTQQQLADKIGTHWITISQWERGQRHPKRESVLQIANALNINEEDIYGTPRLYSDEQRLQLTTDILNAAIELSKVTNPNNDPDGYEMLQRIIPGLQNTIKTMQNPKTNNPKFKLMPYEKNLQEFMTRFESLNQEGQDLIMKLLNIYTQIPDYQAK